MGYLGNPFPYQLLPGQRNEWQESTVRKVTGGGPQGATISLLEYLSQSNNCADNVNEIIKLLTGGLRSFNLKQQYIMT